MLELSLDKQFIHLTGTLHAAYGATAWVARCSRELPSSLCRHDGTEPGNLTLTTRLEKAAYCPAAVK